LRHFIAVIDKDPGSSFGVSFPDWPGCFSAGETLDEAITNAVEALSFMAEDWTALTGQPIPSPRSFDELRLDADFVNRSRDAVVAAIPFRHAEPVA
jgi:predicted RNase H-like HicB family nuclease